MDGEKTQRINQRLHPYAPSLEPSHPGEEGKLINISLGYKVLPLCMGPAKLCINIGWQTWAFILPPKEDFRTLLPFFCLWTMFTTETLGKELGKEQKTLCKRLLTQRWNSAMTKDFLAGLLLLLESSSISKLGLNYRHRKHMETCCQHQRTWDLDRTFHRDQSWS